LAILPRALGLGACLETIWDWERRSVHRLSAPLKQEELEQPTLLVCPTSVLGNWGEVKKFGPTLKVLMHHGDKRPKGKAFTSALQRQDLVITSYALIHRDMKELKAFPGKEWSWMKPKY